MSEREKSALYPGSTLSDCIKFAEAIDSFKNKTVAYNAVAEKYGLSSCATKSFTQKISSAKQYGLITTNSATIQLTELSKKILYPTTGDINSLKNECFRLPPLYASLISEYEGKAIPDENILANLLMSKYKISRAAKNNAAKIFRLNLEELGYIKAGVFSFESENVEQDSINAANQKILADNEHTQDEETFEKEASSDKTASAEYITQMYPVESGKVAKIIIPIDSTEDDLYAIRDLLEVVMKRKFKIKVDD
jgi:hypothetical protein